MKFKLLPLALAFLASSTAFAGVTMGNSQATFSASGTITQNTNFDSYNASTFTSLSDPFTVGQIQTRNRLLRVTSSKITNFPTVVIHKLISLKILS